MASRTFSSFPFNDFVYLQHQLDQLAQEAFGMRAQTSVATLPVDVFDNGEQIVIQAYLPGVRAEHLDVQVEEGVVTISGQYPQLYDIEDARSYTWYARELRGGRFQRSVTLPYKVDWDDSNATITDGMLRMTFPKAPEAKPRRIAITNTASAVETPELTAVARE